MKPSLNNQISLTDFKNYYWLKSELIAFCKSNQLATAGAKEELTQRIAEFLTNGTRQPHTGNQPNKRDSDQPLQPETLVVNYRNDAATRDFFTAHLGKSFRFNVYLRQFTNKANITPGLTYGDLIAGWKHEEAQKKAAGNNTEISSQFEYNRFVREFFANEPGKTHADAVAAWNLVKTQARERTYQTYLSIKAN